MKITKQQLKLLASHIVLNLKCGCGCKFEEHYNEPCACGWTHIEEWFEDEFNIKLKVYPETLKQFYKENYNMNITINKDKK
jgi:hypothetical protein